MNSVFNNSHNLSEFNPQLSIVIPAYNEEGNIHRLYDELMNYLPSLKVSWEIIFIDDGSTDKTLSKLIDLSQTEDNIKVIEFSRNFGHQSAICAGLGHARGEAVIMMDADLQHPPELIPAMLEKWKEGYDIVYTIRKDSPSTPHFKKITAKAFYKLINLLAKIHIPENSADFRLIDKKVVHEIGSLKEKTKFLRGLINWVGFRQYAIYYDVAPRLAGESKYTIWKMMKFAFDGITSFSAFPLHIATIFGVLVSIFSFIYASYAIYIKLFTYKALPGWTSVLVAILFLGGIQLLCLGVIGEYLNRVFEETKSRPQYIIRSIYGGHRDTK